MHIYRIITRLQYYLLIDISFTYIEMYGGYFDEQIAKQARTAISKAISAGKTNMEVQFPPVPNVEEAKVSGT